jgi:hypothetical protein
MNRMMSTARSGKKVTKVGICSIYILLGEKCSASSPAGQQA